MIADGLRAGTIPAILDRALATVTRPGLQGFWVNLDPDGSIARQLAELIARYVPAAS